MKKVTSLLVFALLFISAMTFAQGTVTGTVVDADNAIPLPGVNILEKGTTNGASTDFDGKFSIDAKASSGTFEISYVGFMKKEVSFTLSNGKLDLGTVILEMDKNALDEVILTSYSLAIDRKTPIAVSTIKAAEIENKLGNQEFPEILKSTPGIYVTKAGGGFGDAELRLRGFGSVNIAVMINGVPVNDMENGRVYWSNWAGLSDVTRSMQVQRGLGAAKVAVPSIGGTVNILTKTTDAEKGGNVFATTGNDGYQKYGFTLSTGKSDNGFAATVAASKTSGNGFVDGTEFEGYSYFVNIAKEINENHQLSFTAFGAPQRHGQRQNRELIQTFRDSENGIKFNRDWGYKNGQVTSIEDNFYHKPQLSLNHYWTISENTSLSTALYASVASGGGSGFSGVNKFGLDSQYRDGYLQPVNIDLIVDENVANGDLGSETILRDSRNDHQWYGALSTLSTNLTDEITLLGGVDLRYYKGDHFQEVKDLLGGSYFLDDSNDNKPVNVAQVGDKISYHNDGIVLWEGLFAQAEYSKGDFDAFVTGAASNTSYKRVDYFNYLDSDPLQETDYQNFFGYSIKGGANYNLDEKSNFFANVGYFEKAPFFDAVFLNFVNDINEQAENEKIFSAELGYGFRTSNFRANINLYHTQWNDRTFTQTFRNIDGSTGSANILGVNALHRGVELDFSYRPTDKLTLTGMFSLGDWTWKNNITDVQIFNDEQELVRTVNLFIKDLKVGDAAQTTFALGADYKVLPSTSIRLDYNFYTDYYADFDPNNRNSADAGQAYEIPTYGLMDLGLTHRFDFGGFETVLRANVNNVFDTEYLSDARDDSGVAEKALVWFGAGRTYTVGAKINF